MTTKENNQICDSYDLINTKYLDRCFDCNSYKPKVKYYYLKNNVGGDIKTAKEWSHILNKSLTLKIVYRYINKLKSFPQIKKI